MVTAGNRRTDGARGTPWWRPTANRHKRAAAQSTVEGVARNRGTKNAQQDGGARPSPAACVPVRPGQRECPPLASPGGSLFGPPQWLDGWRGAAQGVLMGTASQAFNSHLPCPITHSGRSSIEPGRPHTHTHTHTHTHIPPHTHSPTTTHSPAGAPPQHHSPVRSDGTTSWQTHSIFDGSLPPPLPYTSPNFVYPNRRRPHNDQQRADQC